MSEKFSWIDIYKEIVEKIRDLESKELIELIESCNTCQKDYLKDKNGNFINLDLFTFLGLLTEM